MTPVTLDWSSAEVRDGRLEVPLRGELPTGWKDTFGRTVALLPGGDWGKVRVKKDRVRVRNVGEGGEDQLRHFLESVVLQANEAHEISGDEAGDDRDTEEHEHDPRDIEMTQRFRSFAAEPED
jgi:hypothetical protein